MNISRLKFQYDELINEILDKFPKEIWESSITTFADLEIGGGQFVKEIEKRLLKYGHSKENVSKRVFGYAPSNIQLNYAIKKYNLIGTYSIFNIMKDNINKKFDVIVGNPPYQRSSTSAHKLWIDFLNLANTLIKHKGIIGYITPSLIWTGRTNKINKIREIYIKIVTFINFNIDNYFNIGEKISYFIINKNSNESKIEILDSNNNIKLINRDNKPLLINNSDIVINSIINKIESYPEKINFVSDYNTNDGTAAPKNLLNKNIIKKEKDDLYNIDFIHSGAQKYYTNSYHKYGNQLKVFINFSSSYEKMFYGYGVAGKQVEAIIVNDENEAKNIINTLTKKIFLFYIKKEKNGGFNTGIFKLPKIDLTRSWTDEELYEYFNLTQEEIDYIEANV